MRLQACSLAAVLLATAILLSGCSWLPEYMKAKAAINARYEKKEEKIERLYAQGQIGDEEYDRQYEVLYRQWDEELTIAKARAQGVDVASSRSSSSKRRSSSKRGTSNPEPSRFDTHTTEYVGSTAGN